MWSLRVYSLLLALLFAHRSDCSTPQLVLSPTHPSDHLSRQWLFLGPLPAGMRELPFGANPALAYAHPALLLSGGRNGSIPSVFSTAPGAGIAPVSVMAATGAGDPDQLHRRRQVGTRGDDEPITIFSQTLTVQFPAWNWEQLRATAGWSALQWQALGVADLHIGASQHQGGDGKGQASETLSFVMDKVAEFAVVPLEQWQAAADGGREGRKGEMQWYRGDWYSYNLAPQPINDHPPPPPPPAAAVPFGSDAHHAGKEEQQEERIQPYHFPHLLHLQPGAYKLVLRLMYESRIFGDPRTSSPDGVPTVQVGLEIGRFDQQQQGRSSDVDEEEQQQQLKVRVLDTPPSLLLPDVTGGWIAGYGLSLALQNIGSSPATVEEVKVVGALHASLQPSLHLQRQSLSRLLRTVVPLQTRPIDIALTQRAPIAVSIDSLRLALRICASSEIRPVPRRCRWIDVSMPLTHKPAVMGDAEADSVRASFVYTYLTPSGTLDYAVAIPPRHHSSDGKACSYPTVLGLHGAGVSAADEAWIAAFPRQDVGTWTILPTGGTGWGYDWQLRSFDAARAAAGEMMMHLYGFPPDLAKERSGSDARKLFVVGHSNGGQGATYMIGRRPDDVVAGIIAAGYVKLAEYVSLSWQAGHRHQDHFSRSVLDSSLHMFENDLHARNLAGIPLLWKYGSEDDNVPPYHSTLMHSLVSSWNARP